VAITYSNRLQLAKPDADEFQLVSVIDANYDLIDKYTNARIVADNVTPPNNELYDGAFVHEKNSGRTWIAVMNAGGTFDKHYLASNTRLYQVPIRPTASLDNLINAPGTNNGFTDPYNRGTVAYNRLFHVSWAVTVIGAANQSNIIQAEAWYNTNGIAYDRHPAVPATFANECYISCPAGQPAVFQGVVSKVSGTGVITLTGDPRFTHFQFTEQAVA